MPTAKQREGTSLLRALVRHARAMPDTAALIFPSAVEAQPPQELSWSELEARVAATAQALLDAGVRPGEVVLILTPDTPEQMIAFLGSIGMGALPTILSYPSVKQSEAKFLQTFQPIVEKTRARWIVSADQFAGVVDRFSLTRIVPPAGRKESAEFAYVEPQAALFLQFSSGTTGLRKGIAVTEGMFESQMASYKRSLGLQRGDCIASWLPLYHDMGLVGAFLLPIHHGLTSVHLSPFEWLQRPVSILEAISRHGATLTFLPNFAYGFLADRVADAGALSASGVSLSTLRAAINCSEPVRDSAHRAFASRFAPLGLGAAALQVSYAMAENTFAVTQTKLGRPARVDRVRRRAFMDEHRCVQASDEAEEALSFVSCGAPVDDTQVRIAGGAGERQVGEIEIKGASLFAGYWMVGEDPSGARPFTDDGWYRTGDLGYLAEGELFVTGREKDLIISRGVNIYPNDVEETIFGVAGLRPGRAVVFGVFDDGVGTEQLVAMCEVELGADEAEVGERVRSEVLAAHGVRLEELLCVERGALRKSTSGKLSRSANRELYRELVSARADALAPAPSPAAPAGSPAPRGVGVGVGIDGYHKLSGSTVTRRKNARLVTRLERLLAHRAVPSAARGWLTKLGPTYAGSSKDGPWVEVPAHYKTMIATDFRVARVPSEFVSQIARTEAEAQELRALFTSLIESGVLEPAEGGADGFDRGQTFVTLRRPESDRVVFFFKGGATDVVDNVPAVEFASATGMIHHNLVMFRDVLRESYRRGISLEVPTAEALLAWERGYAMGIDARHIYCSGTSLGAYAAIVHGHRLRAEKVWAFSPFELGDAPRLADILRESNGVTEYHIWYGEQNPRDRAVAEGLKGMSGVRLYPVAHHSHMLVEVLWKQQQIPVLLPAGPAPTSPQRVKGTPTLAEILQLVRRLVPGKAAMLAEDTQLNGVLDSFATFQLLYLVEESFGIRLSAGQSGSFATPRHILAVLTAAASPPAAG